MYSGEAHPDPGVGLDKMQIPSAYVPGYERVRPSNPAVADRYIRHTMIGDPVADALVQELAVLDRMEMHRYISVCFHNDEAVSRQAPEILRDFFRDAETLPP